MKWLYRILILVVVMELVYFGAVSLQWFSRTKPALPAVHLVEQQTQQIFNQLARRTVTGEVSDWITLSEALIANGYYCHAEVCLRQAIQQNSDSLDAKFLLAFCLDRTGRTAESTPLYREYSSSARGKRKNIALYAIGRNYLREENGAAAEKVFRELVAYPPADYQLAHLLMRAEKFDDALKIIDKNLKNGPQTVQFLHLKYKLMNALGKQQELHQTQDLQAHDLQTMKLAYGREITEPLFTEYGSASALKNFRLDPYDDEITIEQRDWNLSKLDRTIQGQKTVAYNSVLFHLANLELGYRQPERVLPLLEKIHELNYNTATLHGVEGDAREMLGEQEKAVAAWKISLLLTPYNVLHKKLAEYYKQQGNLTAHDEHLAEARLLEGMRTFRKSKVPEAKQLIEKSIELNPNNARAWFYQAEINRRLNNRKAAMTSYERCLKLNPYFGRAIRELERLQTTP